MSSLERSSSFFLSALLSAVLLFNSALLPARAAGPAAVKRAGTGVGVRPWRSCLFHADGLLKQALNHPHPRDLALLAVKECHTSLAQQKSPLGYQLLTYACLTVGPSMTKEAVQAAKDLIESAAGTSDMQDLVALSAFYDGRLSQARQALVTYTGDEVRISHPESHAILSGAVTQRGPRALDLILSANNSLVSGTVRGQARKMLLDALIDFFHQHYGAVTTIAKRFKVAYGSHNFVEENDFAETLTACANLLILRPDRARPHALALLSRQPLDPSTPVLVDTVFFSMNQREEGLKLILKREPQNERVCKMGRAWILDEMSQPQDALVVLDALAKILPDDGEVLMQRGRLESELNQNSLALKHLDQYLAKNPRSGQGHILRAQIFVQKEQWPKALADLNSAVDCGYGLVKAVRARSACYTALGRRDMAQNDMNLADVFMQWVR